MFGKIGFFVMIIALMGISGFPICKAAADQDHIGIFFDPQAISNNIFTSVTDEEVTAYLIILNASSQAGVEYFWVTVDWSGGIGLWSAASDCHIAWTPPPTMFAYCEPPLAWSPAIIIATYTLIVDDPTIPADLYVTTGEGEAPNYTPYGNDIGDTIQLFPTSGSYDLPVATINTGPPVSVDLRSWGQLKAIYR